MKLKHRIIILALIGLGLAAALFYWLYLQPPRKPTPLKIDDPRITESIVTNRERVLLIGVDGMDWEIALALINQGRMPNLARLVEHGTHGALKSEPPLISPAIFTTLVTGQRPEVHGIDNVSAKLAFEYREVKVNRRFLKSPALWQMAEFGGRTVAVINYPAASPAQSLEDGVFVADGIAPGRVEQEQVTPTEWREKVKSAPQPRFLPYEELMERVKDSRMKMAYDLDRLAFSIALEVMRKKKPELLIVGLQSLEFITQHFYQYRFPVSLDHYEEAPAEDTARYRPVLEMHYELIDRLIGGLLSEAEGYTVVVVSDHGFGPAYPPHNIFLDLNLLLERMGYLSYEGATCDGMLMHLLKTGELTLSGPLPASASIFQLCQELAAETKKALADGAPRMNPAELAAILAMRMKFVEPETEEDEQRQWEQMNLLSLKLRPNQQRHTISWKETRAWNPVDFQKQWQGIYINLSGREPKGAVAHDEYQKVRKRLIKDLNSLRTENGDKLFLEVKANPDKKGIYSTYLSDLPDVVVRVNREALIQDYAFRERGEADPIPLAAVRLIYSDLTALPTPEGIFIVSGEPAQTFNRVDLNALDLTPTLLWFLGLPVGADMPGQVRREAFDEPTSAREVLYIESWDELMKRRPRSHEPD